MPLIDDERTDRSMHAVVQCTMPIQDRQDFAETALEIGGVVGVRELVTGHRNLRIDLAAENSDEITAAVGRLQRAGLEIEEEELIKAEYHPPFDHFGTDAIEGRSAFVLDRFQTRTTHPFRKAKYTPDLLR